MNLRKQVEPLKKAALQASSLQRHAHHAASRLTWVKRWLKRAYRHHAQSRELKPSVTASIGSVFSVQEWTGFAEGPAGFAGGATASLEGLRASLEVLRASLEVLRASLEVLRASLRVLRASLRV